MINLKSEEIQYTFDDVTLVPQFNKVRSRRDVNLGSHGHLGYLSCPILSANMDTVTGPEMLKRMFQLGGRGVLHRFMSRSELLNSIRSFYESFGESIDALDLSNTKGFNNLILSVGVNDDYATIAELCRYSKTLCVDIAHGHSSYVANTIRNIKSANSNATVIAGNVVTREAVRFLAESGADVIKTGVGSGAICSTRVVTGHGIPQLSALSECVDEADVLSEELSRNIEIISDGGHRSSGDIAKALAVGANYVMLGSLLAGCDECPGDIITINGSKFKQYRGSASKEIQQDLGKVHAAAEGVSHFKPYKGAVEDVVKELCGGLASALTYSGTSTLKDFRNAAKFVRVTHSAYIEGTPHGITS